MTTLGEQQQTAPHELRGNLLFDRYGASPYWALRGFYQHIGGGESDIEFRIDDEQFNANAGYQLSGLEPRPEDDVDELYEYRINIYGEGQRKLPLLIQPRLNWDEDQRPRSVPRDLGLAVNVKIETAVNLEPEEIEYLVPRAISAICDAVGYDWNDRYFQGPPHEYSCITQYERYVRVARDQAKKMVRSDGTFYRLFHLLADEEGSKVEFSNDNTEVVGYNQQLRFNPSAASKLLHGKQRGKQLKHYHPEHVRKEDVSDPLYHPKFGALFKKGWNDNKSVPWDRHRELKEELDATIMNVLHWSGISIEPGPQFIADDHFEHGLADHQVEFVDDPTPELETTQEAILVRTFMNLNDTGNDVFKEIFAIADGGDDPTVSDLEERLPYATSTIYAALKQLDHLIELDDGAINFVSVKLRQMLSEVVERVDDVVKAGAQAVEDIIGMDPHELKRKGRAWQNFINRYAARLVEHVDKPDELHFRTMMSLIKSGPAEYAPEVVHYAGVAWVKAGRHPGAFRELTVEFQNHEGRRIRRKASQLLRRYGTSMALD